MAAKVKWQGVAKTILRYMTLLFITLRACDVINWPWYIVLSPVIAPLALAAACVMITGVAAVASEM